MHSSGSLDLGFISAAFELSVLWLQLFCSLVGNLSMRSKKFLVKHVADKFYPKFSFGPEKNFFIQSPTSLANDFQAVSWARYAESPDFLK